MKRFAVFTFALAVFLSAPPLQALTIKIGSIAPEQSPWGNALEKMAREWNRISGGSIKLTIYHGGIAGDEHDMIRKVKFGQLQGTVVTNLGLASLSQDTLSMSVPLLIRDDAEFNAIFPKIRPRLDAGLERSGFTVVAWSKAGWIRFFAKDPIYTPDDLKAQTLATSVGDDELLQAWRALGYDAVPIPLTQVLTSLNSGLVDAVFASPIAVGGYQWFGITRHMTDLKIAPFTGAILLSSSTWRRIPQELRPQLMKSAEAVAAELNRNISALEEDALTAMESYGLVIHQLSDEQIDRWRKEIEGSYPHIIGSSFPKEMFETIRGYLEEYRRK